MTTSLCACRALRGYAKNRGREQRPFLQSARNGWAPSSSPASQHGAKLRLSGCVELEVAAVAAAGGPHGDTQVLIHFEADPEALFRFAWMPEWQAIAAVPVVGYEAVDHGCVAAKAVDLLRHGLSFDRPAGTAVS